MADGGLGTLWFGADVDLTNLKKSINQGNQSILDALKMSYDPQSYQQMVAKLKQQLASETFQINVSTNAQSVAQNLRQTLQGVGQAGNNVGFDLSGLQGIAGMKRDLIDQRDLVREITADVKRLEQQWRLMQQTYGSQSMQAKKAYAEYAAANRVLEEEKTRQFALSQTKARATLAQQELNKQKAEGSRLAKQLNSDHLRLNTTLAGGIHISTQLGSALSSLFAVHAAKQFLDNVIDIGGQLEKQRISIGAILGDTVKANHLFEQIKDLSVKSPFGVVELDQYTKQLSAYGFQYSELFDMTKRLADISAGAGQDIGRLTLALGHVRSATYLTGITLRQFSMNNIPMLKMLAEYYTELEGKMVSTAEVQKRISERKVSYEDVIEQIRRLTDEGGMFYNMQEKISESLAARYKNLKDAMDIMYGEMAEGSVGDMLKGLASVLLTTTRHWKEVANVMGVAATAFILSKVNIGLNSMALQGNTSATVKNIMATKQLEANQLKSAATYRTLTAAERIKIASSNSLTVADIKQAMAEGTLTKEDTLRLVALKKLKIAQAMHLVGVNGITEAEIRAAAAAGKWKTALAGVRMSLKNAFAGIGAGTWVTIGLMAGAEIYSAYTSWVDKIDDKSKEMQDLIKSRILDLEKERKALENEGKPTDQKELQARADSMKQVLANSEAYTKTIDQQVKSAGSLSGQYDILAGAIDNAIERNRRLLDVQSDVADMIKASSVYSGEGFFDKLGQGARWFFNDDITKNMSQTQVAYKELRQTIDAAWEYRDAIKGVIEEMINAGMFSKDFEEYLKNAPFEEQIRLLAESQYWDQIVDRIVSSDVNFVNFADRLKEAAGGVTERWDEIANDDIPRMMKRFADKRGMDEKELREWAVNNIDDFKMMLDGINDQLDIKEPAIRQKINRLFYDYVRLGQVAKGVEAGALIGGNVFDSIYEQLKDEELATLKSDTGGKGGSGGSKNKTDKQLKEWKEQLKELENFYKVYKRNVEYMTKDDAIQKALDSGVFKITKESVKDIDDYLKVLKNFRKKVEQELGKNPSTERKSFLTDLITKIDEKEFEVNIKKAADKAAKEMQEYISKKSEKFNLYKALLEKTGNKGYAKLAFQDGKIWDDLSKQFANKLQDAIQKAGKDIDLNQLWSLSDAEAQEMLKGIDGAYDLWKKIVEIVSGNYVDALNKGGESMSNIMTTSQKLLAIEQKIAVLREKYNNSTSEAEKRSLYAQIKSEEKNYEQAKDEAFKQSEDYQKFFSAIYSLTIDEAEKIGDAIHKNLDKALQDGRISAQEYYETIEKINSQLKELEEDRGPLMAFMSGGLSGLSTYFTNKGRDTYRAGTLQIDSSEKKLKELKEIAKNGEINVAEQMVAAQAKQAGKDMQAAGNGMQAAGQKMAGAMSVIDMIVNGIDAAVQGFKEINDEIKEIFGEEYGLGNKESRFLNAFSEASSGAAKGWNSLKNGDIQGAVSGTIQSISAWFKMESDKTAEWRELQGHLSKMENALSSIDARLKERVDMIRGEEAQKSGRQLIADYSALRKQTIETAQGWLDAKTLHYNHSNWWYVEKGKEGYGYNGQSWLSVMPEIMSHFGLQDNGTGLSQLWDLNKEQIQWIQENYRELWIRLPEEFRSYLEDIIDYGEQIEQTEKDMAKANIGLDLETLESDYADFLSDLDADNEKMAENFEAYLRKAIMSNLIGDKYTQRISELIEYANTKRQKAKEEGRELTKEEIDDIREREEAIRNDLQTEKDYYYSLYGWTSEASTAFSDLRSTFLDTLTDMEGDAESFRKSLEQIMVKDLIEKRVLDVPFTINGMTFENFDAYLKDWNKRYAEAVKAENQEAIDALLDELVQARELTIEAAQELRERLKTATEDDTFKGMSDSWVSNLMDMSKTAEDWAEEVGKVMAEKIIKEMIVPTLIQPYLNQLQEAWNTALPNYTSTDENGNKTYNWEGLLGDEAVNTALDAIYAAYPAASDAVKTVMERLGIDISNYAYDGFSNLGDSIIDSLKSADGSLESWAREQGKSMAEQMAKAYVDQNYGEEIKDLNKEWQEALEKGDAEAIDTVRKKLEALYAKMGQDEQLRGLIEDFKELDTTVSNLSDSLVSSLMDMSKTARDWGQDLAKTIAEAVIKATVVPTMIQPMLNDLQDLFSSVVESATSIGADGKKGIDWKAIIGSTDLMNAINGIVEQYPQLKEVVEKIMSAFGIDLYDNPFSGMADDFTSSLMNMEESAEDFARNISRTLTEQMVKKVITDQFQGQIDALGDQWREALDRGDAAAIENIKNQLVALREKMGEAVQPLLDAISDLEKEADTTFSSMTDSWVSALSDMEGTAEDWAKSVGKTMAQKIITEMIAPVYITPLLNAMQKAFDIAIAAPGATIASVLATMTPWIQEIENVYNEIQPMVEQIFGSFGIYKETVEEAAEEVQYALDDLKSNFVSSLMDMTESAEDFAKNISKILAQSFIEKFVLGDAFDRRMEEWQQRYEQILGTGMSEDERKRQLKQLRDEIAAAREDYASQAAAVLDLFGLSASSEQEATMNMSDKITYDQADQLLGTSLAQLLTQEQILALLKGGSLDYTPMFDSLVGDTGATDNNSQLIASTLQAIADINRNGSDNILTQVAMANSHLMLIRDYSKRMCDQVEMHMASIDSKLSNLRNL